MGFWSIFETGLFALFGISAVGSVVTHWLDQRHERALRTIDGAATRQRWLYGETSTDGPHAEVIDFPHRDS